MVQFERVWRCFRCDLASSGLIFLNKLAYSAIRDVDLEVKYAFLGAGNDEKTYCSKNISWWPGFDLELFQVSYGGI